ncbi:MAG: DUF4956 domain-containing protein [Gammaproteobacteria bacterium]|nr:DUF4956 domain-containing protein [Gammaproteobacteria bacterium]NNC98311.1 DUF4956 domain-containing protein [Gammaproteobacteria bacterium]NNM12788.1 DUF4956 domain-containing protein [Gammaproteobacteria bacterium]
MQDNFNDVNFRQPSILFMLLIRMTVYYLIIFGIVALFVWLAPGMTRDLPVGGIGEFTNYQDSTAYELEETLLGSDGDELEAIAERTQQRNLANGPIWLNSAKSLFLAMFTTFILMIPVSWVYKAIHQGSVYDHSIDETALILPAVVAGIVTVVQHSLALAFSLAGIVAGVRFRRALSDTFDTLFIFVAIGVGIAAGIKSVEIAIVMTVFFNYTTVLVCMFGDGLESQYLAKKKQARQEKKEARIITAENSDQIISAVTPPDITDNPKN